MHLTVNPESESAHPSPRADTVARGRNIVLIGLMGAGKTTVGKIAAHSLGFGFIDTDQIITDAAGKTIPQIFEAEGEAGFRHRETEALRSLLGHHSQVIATGGGIVTKPENLPLLKQLGLVAWLYAEPSTLRDRTSHNHDRPLLRNDDPEGTLRNLLTARRSLYEAACDVSIATDDLSPQDVAYGLTETAQHHFSRLP